MIQEQFFRENFKYFLYVYSMSHDVSFIKIEVGESVLLKCRLKSLFALGNRKPEVVKNF